MPLGGLARKLIQLNLLQEDVATTATEEAKKRERPFISYLVENRLIDPTVLAIKCSEEFGLPVLDLNAFDQQKIPHDILEPDLVTKHHALPIFRRGNRLYVAISDPTNLKAVDEIKYHTNINTEAILVEEHKFLEVIDKALTSFEAASLGTLDADLEAIEISETETAPEEGEGEDAPIVRFINKLILEAVNLGVSDLHFEPYESIYRVRFRRDGVLYEHSAPPANMSARFAARLKVMARLDISERRLPQDGRFKMKISNTRSLHSLTLYNARTVPMQI